MPSPVFEVTRALSVRRRWTFRLRASNGEIVCSGELYNTKAAARAGIEAVREAASTAVIHDLTR
jgi:uncharacterized protein YegP (UPF0339 family)